MFKGQLGQNSTDIRDQAYTYDGLHWLVDLDQGTDTGNDGDIDTLKFAQNFTLDQLGNWPTFKQDDNGDATWNVDQDRTHNEANEVSTISDWPNNPVHDAAGNLTSLLPPNDPTGWFLLKYDAWNRLITVDDDEHGLDTVQRNEYDGLHRRIVRDETGGGNDIRHFYYNEKWQCLEERVEASGTIDPDPINQHVWGPNYIDELAIRWYDSNTDNVNVKSYTYQHDANFNVIAVATSVGLYAERLTYTPYGEATYLGYNFSKKGTQATTIGNEFLYTGRRLDPETGLQQSRARYYHAPLGRFLNRDPILYRGGMNLYQYVHSQPTIVVDPFGLREVIVHPIPGWVPADDAGVLPGRLHPRYTPIDDDGTVGDQGEVAWEESVGYYCEALGGTDCPVSSRDDAAKKLSDLASDECISKLIIITHGSSGSFLLGSVFPKDNQDDARVDSEERIDEVFNCDMFCDDCEIIIVACGVGADKAFIQYLANSTGCSVTAQTGRCSSGPQVDDEENIIGWEVDPSDPVNKPPIKVEPMK